MIPHMNVDSDDDMRLSVMVSARPLGVFFVCDNVGVVVDAECA